MHPTYLRPLRASDILDTAFRLYRAAFFQLLVVTGLVLLPAALVQVLFKDTPAATVISLVQSFLLVPLITAALTAASLALYHGQAWALADAYRQGWHHFRAVFTATIAQVLVVVLPLVVVSIVVGVTATLFGNNWPLTIGLLVITIAPIMIFFITKYAVTYPAILAESLGGTPGMSRSWKLTSGWFWHAAGVQVAAALLTFALSTVPAFVLGYLAPNVPGGLTWIPLVNVLITQFSLLLALPFQQLVSTCLYYDLSVRNEGYDLALAAQSYQHDAQAHSGAVEA